MNAGDDKAVVTSTNGDWDNAAAERFTAAAGTPFSGVQVGDFASVYLDGATVAVFVSRVTAVNGGGASLDLSTTAKSGTKPAAGATGRTCTTGGKWKGPNAAENFPFNFVTAAMTNASGHEPRVNFLNTATYSITAAITHTLAGPVQWEGCTTTPGDGGKATFDGGTSGAAYSLLSVSGAANRVKNFIFSHNGATGAPGNGTVLLTGAGCVVEGCVIHDVRGSGFFLNNSSGEYLECEAYAVGSGTDQAGFNVASGWCVNCISHDNTTSGVHGFNNNAAALAGFLNCIADTNASVGFRFGTGSTIACILLNCDSYNNGGDGALVATSSGTPLVFFRNSNLVKNGGYGVNITGAGVKHGVIQNCGFGAGTQVNTSGSVGTPGFVVESGSVTYAADVTPWVDPANGDFRICLPAALGAGRGAFLQTAASYAGTVGYPDIGASPRYPIGPRVHPGMGGGARG